MTPIKRCLPLLILLFTLLSITASNAQKDVLHLQSFTLEDGLSSTNFITFYQDSRGIIWLGTSYGLNRYDGTGFRSYTKEDNGLCYNYVSGITEDGKGNLWIMGHDYASGKNFYCIFDPIDEVFYSIEEYTGEPCPFKPDHTKLLHRYKGTFLLIEERLDEFQYYEVQENKIEKGFSLKKKKGYRYLKNNFPTFKLDEETYVGQVGYTITDDREMYGGPYIPFYLHADGTTTSPRFIEAQKKQGFSFSNMFPIESGILYRLNSVDSIASFYLNDKPLGKIKSADAWHPLFVNDHKTYGFNDSFLSIFNITADTIVLEQQLKYKDKVASAFSNFAMDKIGNFWFSLDNKIQQLSVRKQNFERYLDKNPRGESVQIRGIATAPDGKIFLGNYFCLYTKEPHQKEMTWVRQAVMPAFEIFYGVLYDEGNLWLATEKGGLGLYSIKDHRIQYFGEGFMWIPYKAADGSIWAGAGQGLYKLDADRQLRPFKDYGRFNELKSSSVYAFHKNDKGTWLSTSSGMYLVDLSQEKVLARYSDTQAAPYYIPANHIAHIYEDKEGIFWLASKGQGLVRWDPDTGKSEHLTKGKVGLSHNVIYAVYEDDFGNLWLPTDYGLNCLNKTSRQITLYLEEDGLPNNEFNTIAHHRDKAGNFYFGTIDGMIKFHPKDFAHEGKDIPFIITACNRIDRTTDSLINRTRSVLEQHSITIQPSDKAVHFTFTLLDYTNPKGNQYAYKIEGYRDKWTYQKTASLRVYGLPYGSYKLRLRGKASGSNKWIEYANPIQIIVAKPFYLQWWFLLSSLFVIIGSVFYGVRRNNKKLLERQEELETLVEERTEEIQQQAEELKQLDKVKSNFFANISHELRTPLTLILGPLSYLLENPDNWEKEHIQKQLLVMQRNGKSLMQLIEEILDLSKLEANKLELQEEGTPVVQFFEYIFFVFEPQFQSQDLQYDLILNVKDDLHVLMDRKKIEKVLNNFLSNAIKFTPKGGKISLSVTETDSQLNIQVSDTGKGVHPKDLPYIFDRFYQSKQADQKLYGGTGIGLALVMEFAQLMGGRAYADSALGVGSNFYFELPKKEVTAAKMLGNTGIELLEEEQVYSIGNKFTILVVEDNQDMRDFVFQLLQEKYERILLAKNGAEGLAVLEEQGTNIHLIISDVMMPEVDGLTMLKEIKNNSAWNGIPVIMLTALAAERDKLTALTIGVDDYLTKPFSVPELLIRVQNLLYNYHQRLEWQKTETNEIEGTAEEIFIENKVKEKAPQAPITEKDKNWVDELTKLVENSFGETKLDVETLAASVFLSSRQLNRKLKPITGLSPGKFIREVQLHAARKALENGAYISVTEVAYSFGFEHPGTFSTVFKRRFGKSPRDYLKL